jgi:hypothetical protein
MQFTHSSTFAGDGRCNITKARNRLSCSPRKGFGR